MCNGYWAGTPSACRVARLIRLQVNDAVAFLCSFCGLVCVVLSNAHTTTRQVASDWRIVLLMRGQFVDTHRLSCLFYTALPGYWMISGYLFNSLGFTLRYIWSWQTRWTGGYCVGCAFIQNAEKTLRWLEKTLAFDAVQWFRLVASMALNAYVRWRFTKVLRTLKMFGRLGLSSN